MNERRLCLGHEDGKRQSINAQSAFSNLFNAREGFKFLCLHLHIREQTKHKI